MTGSSGQGAHTWPRECPFCHETYHLTNWMRRRILLVGYGQADTHLLACVRKLNVKVEVRRHG